MNATPALLELPAEPFGLRLEPPLLVARFPSQQRVASWAIVNGGIVSAEAIAWLEVRNADLPRDRDPRLYLAQQLRAPGWRTRSGS